MSPKALFGLVAVPVASLALIAAGCGGGSKTLSKEEYGSKLNQICADYNAKQKEIGTPNSIAEVGEKGPDLIDAFDNAISDAEKLKAPDELAATRDEFLAKSKELRNALSDLVDAAKANDAAKVQEIGGKADGLGQETDALGKQLGAPACATD